MTNDLGNRISKTDSAGTTSLLFDGARVFADSRADYTVGGVTGLISERASGVTKTYHGDQLGSTRGLTNSSQTVTDSREYDNFGLLMGSSGTTATPFGFVGGEGYQRDADSGLMLLGARLYDPSIGRFISRDPIGYEGGLNLYGYCENDPVNSLDSSGEGPSVPPWVRAGGGWSLIIMAAYFSGRALREIHNEEDYARRGYENYRRMQAEMEAARRRFERTREEERTHGKGRRRGKDKAREEEERRLRQPENDPEKGDPPVKPKYDQSDPKKDTRGL